MTSTAGADRLIAPYGGTLVDRLSEEAELVDRAATAAAKLTLQAGTRIHLSNIATGCYSPLAGFMSEAEYRSVISAGRLPSGHDWKVPVLLHADGLDGSALRAGAGVALCNDVGMVIGAIDVESVFEIDSGEYCRAVMGTDDATHPGVAAILRRGEICIGGRVLLSRTARQPERHEGLPQESRAALRATGKSTFAAFSTRNICHRGHEYQHRIALDRTDVLGIHVITGATMPGSFASDVVLDVYEKLIADVYPRGRCLLNNLRLPPIYAGPKEAFLQATVLQNLGYTHFIVGRDHAGVGSYYERYASQEIFAQPSTLDIEILALAEPHYCIYCDDIVIESACDRPAELEKLNGRDVRRMLVEKRYNELDTILRPEVRDLLIARHRMDSIFIA